MNTRTTRSAAPALRYRAFQLRLRIRLHDVLLVLSTLVLLPATPAAAGAFPPDTLISTPQGDTPIRRLRSGDNVLTHDANGQPIPARLLTTTVRSLEPNTALIRLKARGGRQLSVVATHVVAPGKTAADLRPGDRLGDVEIETVELMPWGDKPLYDILPAGGTAVLVAGGIPVLSGLAADRSAAPRHAADDVAPGGSLSH